jgi:hypothetical protein
MRTHYLCVALLLAGAAFAQTTPVRQEKPETDVKEATGSASLPVKKVVLYKNGVGYFEHTGRVHGNQELGIEFTTAQLNDVLKSLTVVDLNGGKINGVRYNSVAPLSERLKSLQIPLSEDVTSAAFLIALRGTRVEVRNGAASTLGKVFSVETVKRETSKGGTLDVTQLAIVTDAGELRLFELGPGVTVRAADSEIREDVSRYLSLVGSTRSKDVRRMTISATGSGDRNLFVSYISEVPVWKSTYRIVVPRAPGTPFLQGWAIIDNTVGEDWKDVQLSMVSGAPQSFIQNISQPYYTRRPVVPLPQSVMLTPQAHEASMEEGIGSGAGGGVGSGGGIVGGVPGGVGGGTGGGVFRAGMASKPVSPNAAMLSGTVVDPSGAVVPNADVVLRNTATGAVESARTDNNGSYSFSGVEAGPYSLSISSQGFKTTQFSQINLRPGFNSNINATLSLGSVSEAIEVSAGANTSQNSMVMAALRGASAAAEGSALGELFQYSLKEKITVLKNQSALVPIVQSPIDAEKVTLVTTNEDGEVDGTPLRALWMTNSSGLTLDGGTFNILEEDSFAGEGIMDVLHPGERRLLSYAADTAVHVTTESEPLEKTVKRVTIVKGVMKVTREERDTATYTIHNADSTPRQVILEHPIREEWKLAEGTKPEESGSTHYRFRVAVAPGKTEKFVVKESRPAETSIYVSTITDTQVAAFVEEKTIKPPVEEALRRVIAKKNEISEVEQEMRLRQTEMEAIDKDQARLRENMKALKGSPEEKALLQRYTRQLDGQEDRLAVLKKENADLQTKRAALQAQLNGMVQEIAVDETL